MVLPKKNRRSNPGILARIVAGALGSFCEIDETMISSRLIKNSRISLQNLRLIPRIIQETDDHVLETTGTVDSVVFKWKWNMIGRRKKDHEVKGYMKKSTLIMKGVNIKLQSRKRREADRMNKTNSSSTSSSSKNNSSREESEMSLNASVDSTLLDEEPSTTQEKKGFRKKFVKNILDQLSLHIDDVNITIEPPTKPGDEVTAAKKEVIVHILNIGLESLGRLNFGTLKKGMMKRKERKLQLMKNRNAPLMQQLNVNGLSARVVYIDEKDMKRVVPMISPFSYSAKVKRFHGERFAGLGEGIEVTGEGVSPTAVTPISPSNTLSNEEVIDLESRDSVDCRDDTTSQNRSLLYLTEVEILADEDEIETSLNHGQSREFSESLDSAISETFFDNGAIYDMENQCSNSNKREGIHIHLGKYQTTALFGMINMFTIDKPENPLVKELEDRRRTMINSIARPGGLKAIAAMAPNAFVKGGVDLNKSSRYHLPFHSIHVTLPNNAVASAIECEMKMRADGSVSLLEATGGATVNGQYVLEKGSRVCVDLIKHQITMQPRPPQPHSTPLMGNMSLRHAISKDYKEDTDFNFDLDEIKDISVGLGDIMSWKRKLSTSGTNTIRTRSSGVSSTPPNWSMKIDGTTSLNF